MSKHTCPKCGATLVAPDATCRRCLMELAANWKANPAPEGGPEPESIGTGTRPRAGKPPPTPAELAPLFPELELEELIGVGGMGAVYRARQKRLGRAVALKVLHDELSGDPLFVERFLREAQALAKLAHPGIVAVHDFGEREHRCYLVMEFVDGANLRALLKQGLLAPRQALDIVRQLCDGLQFAHDEGVVHRDIKPENVLVDRTGRVKIADFGLAKLVGGAQASLTSAGQVMGTPHYMAPEQLEHPRDVDHRADLFSLGVVFYEMLTGELPLGRFAPPSQRVQIDVRLDEIVLKSLERERERRYQHAAQVKTDVETVERGPAAAAAAPAAEDEEHGVKVEGARVLVGMRVAQRGGKAKTIPMLDIHGPFAWFLAFAAAWCIAGVAFSFGALAFTLLAPALVGGLLVGYHRDRAPEEARAAWRALTKGRRFALGTASAILFLLGALSLFGAHVASWERGTRDYVPGPQTPEAMVAQARDYLAKESGSERAIDLEVEASFTLTDPYSLAGAPPLVMAVCGALLLLGALRCLDPRRSDRQAGIRPWGAAVHSLTLALLPLLCWDGLQFLGSSTASERLIESGEGKPETVADRSSRLYAGLIERGYAVRAQAFLRAKQGDPNVSTPGSKTHFVIVDLTRGQLLAAAPASAFDRWQIAWSGPERTQPAVYVQIFGTENETRRTTADAGSVDPSSPHLAEWRGYLAQVVAR